MGLVPDCWYKSHITWTVYNVQCILYWVPVEVIGTDEFTSWYQGLDDTTADDVDVAVGVLESQGVALGAPRSSDIKGATFALRELRFQSMARPFRIFYA